jgi:hypothetical protein
VTRALPAYVALGQPSQLTVDQRRELVERTNIALTPGQQEVRRRWSRLGHPG